MKAKKTVSILGDSISTFEGWNPEGYLVFYNQEAAEQTGVVAVEDTWWYQVAHDLQLEILANNSYSGSRASGAEFPAANCDRRIDDLARDGREPDWIIVYLGANDYGGGVAQYGAGTEAFDSSYKIILQKLSARYPKSQIICVASWYGKHPAGEDSMLSSGTPERNFSQFNDSIRAAAAENGCFVVDMERSGLSYDSVDGVHPTQKGMKQIAAVFVEQVRPLLSKNCV